MKMQEQIIELAKSGIPPRDIATRLNLEPNAVSVIISSARRAGHNIEKFSQAKGLEQKVIRMAKAGKPPKEIAALTGLARGTVYAYITKARQRGEKIQRFASGGIAATDGTRVTVPKEVTLELRRHAFQRNMTTAAFANLLLREIVVSDLVDAVLDDAEWLKDALIDGEGNHA